MKKLLFALLWVMIFAFAGCTQKVTGDEKTAEDFIKSKGYTITARKGEVQRYVLEKTKLYGGTETIPYQQAWGVQTVEPYNYFGKEITIYCFTVKNHPLEDIYKVRTNVYIMMCDSKAFGGYSFPDKKLAGSVYSLGGKTLEEVTGLSFKQWQDDWKNKYGN